MNNFFLSWIAIIFPLQKLVRKYLPRSYEKYPITWIIIDGTEIFVKRATSMKAQTQIWFNYKHYNIWSALVGISPNGIVTFVSSPWTGRVLDKVFDKMFRLAWKTRTGRLHYGW